MANGSHHTPDVQVPLSATPAHKEPNRWVAPLSNKSKEPQGTHSWLRPPATLLQGGIGYLLFSSRISLSLTIYNHKYRMIKENLKFRCESLTRKPGKAKLDPSSQ